jgi:hypothetical protein
MFWTLGGAGGSAWVAGSNYVYQSAIDVSENMRVAINTKNSTLGLYARPAAAGGRIGNNPVVSIYVTYPGNTGGIDHSKHLELSENVTDAGFAVQGEEVGYADAAGVIYGFGNGANKISGTVYASDVDVPVGGHQVTVIESDNVFDTGVVCCLDYEKLGYQGNVSVSSYGIAFNEGAAGTKDKLCLPSATISILRNTFKSNGVSFMGITGQGNSGGKPHITISQNTIDTSGAKVNEPAFGHMQFRGLDYMYIGQNKLQGIAGAFKGTNNNAFVGNNLSAASYQVACLLLGPDANGNAFNGSGKAWENYIVDPSTFVANPPNYIAGVTKHQHGLGAVIAAALKYQADKDDSGNSKNISNA